MLVKYPDTWVITDDIYNRMVFDGIGYHNFVHARPELRDRVIFIDSLSKTYGMPGWRVGFMAGPEAVAKAIVTMNSNHITNLPEVVTAAARRRAERPAGHHREKCAEFQRKRDQVMAVMDAIPGVVCPRPQGAFYVFPDIQRRVRQDAAQRHWRSATTSTSAARCSKPRASRACRVRHSARRRALRIQLHLPDAATGSRACSASRNFSPNW